MMIILKDSMVGICLDVKAAASKLTKKAFKISLDHYNVSPFYLEAKKHGIH